DREHMREQAFDAARTMYRPNPAAPTPAPSSTGGDTATDRDEAATARASERISNDLIATRVAEADAEDSLTMRAAVPPGAKDKASAQKLPLPAPDVTDQSHALTLGGTIEPPTHESPLSTKPSSPPKVISTAPSSLPPPSAAQAATSSASPSPACPQCEAPMAWVEQHLRFFCKSCRMYF
ncbi:MAG: hypothetical protein AB7L28_18780, partial [Kofleriaceae bacterium]